MKLRIAFLAVAALATALSASAQTSSTTCPAANTAGTPAVCLTWNNNAMAATQTNNTNGQETSGPGTAELWICNGNGAQCAAGMLPSSGANDTLPTGSGWVLAGTVPQTQAAGSGAILNLQFGALYLVTVRNAWTAGGGYGGFTATFPSITVPAAPATQPPAASAPVVTVVL